MSENKEQNALVRVVRGKAQYLIAFGVIASLLVVANIPLFVVFFFGIFAYFMAKMFASGPRSHTREIFEFYLSAHEILRDDVRQWYGFEINETIARGEKILKAMHRAPPLVHYALGALYHKTSDYSAAERHLAFIAENADSSEASIVYPTPELRSYVSVLRKIEREPGDAPLTSAAVRALERARKIKCVSLLADCRIKIGQRQPEKLESADAMNGVDFVTASQNSTGFEIKADGRLFSENENRTDTRPVGENENQPDGRLFSGNETRPHPVDSTTERKRKDSKERRYASRKPITEVLHDIYDKNIQ